MGFERGKDVREALNIGSDQRLLNRIRPNFEKAYILKYSAKGRWIRIMPDCLIPTWITKYVMGQLEKTEGDSIRRIHMTKEDVIIIRLL